MLTRPRFAASIIPANQVSKMFSPDIGKDYIVVEIAIYPENGVPFDVEAPTSRCVSAKTSAVPIGHLMSRRGPTGMRLSDARLWM